MQVSDLTNFTEFLNAPIYIGRDASELQAEIDANCWAVKISVSDQQKRTEGYFRNLFRQINANRLHQLDNSGHLHGLISYMWFDEQAGQLRFCFISDFHEELPFKAKVNQVSFAEVIRQCLESKSVEGIPFTELTMAEGSSIESQENKPLENYTVNVYVQHFPQFLDKPKTLPAK